MIATPRFAPTPGRVIGSTLKYATLIVASALVIVPLLAIFLGSFETYQEFNRPGFPLPGNFLNLDNYATALTNTQHAGLSGLFAVGGMGRAFLMTGLVLVPSCIGTILIGTMTAYVLSRFKSRFTGIVQSLFLLSALIPAISTQVATFQIINFLGVYNTALAPIILYLGTDVISLRIFLQFANNIPFDIDEAALIDGSSFFGVYWRVMLPLLRPAIATVVILKVIAIYNDFYTPFLYMPDKSLGTVSTSLFRFIGPYSAHYEVVCAGVIIITLPTLILFILLQQQIYNGFSGAVK
jgi:multiple sugar transport system permease protein